MQSLCYLAFFKNKFFHTKRSYMYVEPTLLTILLQKLQLNKFSRTVNIIIPFKKLTLTL